MQNIFNLPKEKVSAAGRLNGLRLRPFLARRQHSKPMSSTCTASSVNGEGCFTKVTLAIQHAIPFGSNVIHYMSNSLAGEEVAIEQAGKTMGLVMKRHFPCPRCRRIVPSKCY